MRKPLVQYIHVNKRAEKWTVHNSKGCFHFDHVLICTMSTTVHKPKKKENPKFFIRTVGRLIDHGDGNATIIK